MKIFTFLSILILFGIPGPVFSVPGDLGYRIIHSNITVRNNAPGFSVTDFIVAKADYSSAGNLSFAYGASNFNPPFSANVFYLNANYGATGWAGLANARNASNQLCSTFPGGTLTGNCTMSNGADWGMVYFNTFYNPSPSTALRAHLIRHEFGHIIGMAHSHCPSPTDSIMAPSSGCSPMRTTLQPADTTLINSWYP